MTEQEIDKIKSTILEMLKFHIQAQKLRLEILESLKLQTEKTDKPEDLKKIHDDLAIMLGMSK